jgi:hypothetical protein
MEPSWKWLPIILKQFSAAELVLYGVMIAFLATASVAIELHALRLSLSLFAVALLLYIPTTIIFKKHDKAAAVKIAQLNKGIDALDLVPAKTEDFPWLDGDKVEKWTNELSNMGYVVLGDFTLSFGDSTPPQDVVSQSLSRLMANPDSLCFAEVGQSKHPQKGTLPAKCSITTFFTSGRQVQTTNAELAVEAWAKPGIESMWTKLEISVEHKPGASPRELHILHQEQRETVRAEYGLSIVQDISFGTYRQCSKRVTDRMRSWAKDRIAEAEL